VRLIDWLLVLGIIAVVGGPLITIRMIAKQDAARRKGKPLPPAQPYDNKSDD